MHVATESSPCTSDLRSYEIDYDEISECTESVFDISHKKGMTARGNEISPAKMPLMRIRSVEIVFEDEMSTCTDTGILDRSLELLVSDSSDDSTKCEDLELLERERYDSVTLNADGDLSEVSSLSLTKDNHDPLIEQELQDSIHVQTENLTLPPSYKVTVSPNVSDIGDSGRYTEDATSSHIETVVTYDDALLSHSCDIINVDKASTSYDLSEVSADRPRLYEYIDSGSDSDDTATCDVDCPPITNLSLGSDPLDGFEQYDSFIDMGKF